MSESVRISNANPGEATHTSLNRAQRYVADGRAEWVCHRKTKLSIRLLEGAEIRRRATQGLGGMASIREMRKIPILNPTLMLTRRSK